jgi:hypothetical protein
MEYIYTVGGYTMSKEEADKYRVTLSESVLLPTINVKLLNKDAKMSSNAVKF